MSDNPQSGKKRNKKKKSAIKHFTIFPDMQHNSGKWLKLFVYRRWLTKMQNNKKRDLLPL